MINRVVSRTSCFIRSPTNCMIERILEENVAAISSPLAPRSRGRRQTLAFVSFQDCSSRQHASTLNKTHRSIHGRSLLFRFGGITLPSPFLPPFPRLRSRSLTAFLSLSLPFSPVLPPFPSPSSIIWHRSRGGDALRLGR